MGWLLAAPLSPPISQFPWPALPYEMQILKTKKILIILYSFPLLQCNKHLPLSALCHLLHSTSCWITQENLFWVILSQFCIPPPPPFDFPDALTSVYFECFSLFYLKSDLWSSLTIFHCLRKRDCSYQWENTLFPLDYFLSTHLDIFRILSHLLLFSVLLVLIPLFRRRKLRAKWEVSCPRNGSRLSLWFLITCPSCI